MNTADLLIDAFGRVRDAVHEAVDGLSADAAAHRIGGDTNSIAWLVWHLTRVQDDHVAGVAGTEQVLTAGGWHDRLGVPLEPAATGYGHSSDEVALVRVDPPSLLADYHDAVADATVRFCGGLTDAELDRVVDTRWDPPVTLGVRLVSVVADTLQHAGQAALVRGILARREVV